MSITHFFVTATLFLLLLLEIGAVQNEEDFGFDGTENIEVGFEERDVHTAQAWTDDKVLTAIVGRVFHLVLATRKEFGGKTIKGYEAKSQDGKSLPPWLLFDKKDGIFWGVPLSQDLGSLHLTVRGQSDSSQQEKIIINIVEPTEEVQGIEKCQKDEDNTILTLLLDKNIRAIKPKQRVIAIINFAKFFGLPYSAFTLQTQAEKDDITDSSVILAGPGNLKTRSTKITTILRMPVGCDGRLWLSTAPMIHQLKQQARDGTISEILRLPLIGWRVKTETKEVLRMKRDIVNYDGSGDYNEDYYDEEYEYEDENDLGDIENAPPTSQIPITSPTTATTITTTSTIKSITETTTHPHRHHHGEVNPSDSIAREHQHQDNQRILPIDEEIPITTTLQSSTTTNPKSVQLNSVTKMPPLSEYDEYDYYEEGDDDDPESETIIPDITELINKKNTIVPVFENTETTEETTSKATTKEIVVETSPSTTSTTTPTTTTTVSTTTTTTIAPTTTRSISTTEASTTFQIIVDEPEVIYTTEIPKSSQTTMEITPAVTSTSRASTTTSESSVPVTETISSTTTTTTTAAPTTTTVSTTTSTTEAPTTQEETTVKSTTTKQVPTSVKSTTVREVVTETEFHDNFDPFIEHRLKQMSVTAGKIFRFVIPPHTFKDFEDEYDLTYLLLDANNRTITNNTWLYFNPLRREVYGLPLEEDVSKWVFWVKAFDRDGGSVQEKLNIQVQQHKLDLVVNHEFSLHIRIEKPSEFPHYVDWSLKVLRALGKIYNTNMSEITVRHINNTNEPVVFTWSNDTVPTNYCSKGEIEELYKTLTANDRGDPSRELSMALGTELRVKKVLYREFGVCDAPQTQPTPPMNFSPILRNPVDHINATVGELLLYKVKDDTFYDPEDVDPRALNISLLTGDRQPLPPSSWLQFDSKNREFFGIPRKTGRTEYQLVCVDSGGLPATDSLEVVVHPPPKRVFNVEFVMNITEGEITHEEFSNSALLQKKFVEKLMILFGESTPSNIYLLPFKKSYDSTIVTWLNKSLPITYCPQEEISRLESILHNMNDKSIAHRVHSIMEPEFRVSTIKVHLVNNCKPKITIETKSEEIVPVEESPPQSSSDEYLITFIVPAVIIAIMLFLAAIAAIVLYRRRRMGKMNIEEDGRQSYGNKGIPVIFQEELEDKPESGTKAPVILKDEKPPLAPPEYSKSGSVRLTDDSEPYQPPPPFTRTQENGRKPRPKPTPTYRKPPPYVPP